MDSPTNDLLSQRPDVLIAMEGEFKGWQTWTRDAYEVHNGPFWHKVNDDGSVRCAFRVENKHLNGSGTVNGGCYTAFADYCLFAFARHETDGTGVTVSLSCDFLGAAHKGALIEATGEVTRAGRSLIFLRGILHCGERKLLSFSGTIKRTKPRGSGPQATG
jgi:uncharacterized protein (TIGR00369 family)